ncbi:MAG: YecA family protein [Acidimicrobiales bacterium]
MALNPAEFVRRWLPSFEPGDAATAEPLDVVALVRRSLSESGRRHLTSEVRDTIRRQIAAQIVSGSPPAAWHAAERMVESGIEPTMAGAYLELAFLGHLAALPDGSTHVDLDAYGAALEHLPPPTVDDVTETVVGLVNRHRVMDIDELQQEAGESLHVPGDVAPFNTVIDHTFDALVGTGGPLCLLAGDRVVDRRQLTGGSVLTHRVTEDEIADDALDVTVDLAILAPADEFAVFVDNGNTGAPSVSVHVDDVGHHSDPEQQGRQWHGPDGWLSGLSDGTVVAVRREHDAVHVEPLAVGPELDTALVDLVREAYDFDIAEPGLPASVEDVVLGVLVDHPDAFAVPHPPLGEIFAAAALEIRGSHLAHETDLWDAAHSLRRWGRVMGRLDDDGDGTRQVVSLVECFLQGTGSSALRPCLDTLADPELVDVATDELLGEASSEEGGINRLGTFARALVQRASAPVHVAASRYLEAVVSEMSDDPLAAHAALEIGVEADPRWVPGVARLAWYRSDRGDAEGALKLFRQLEDQGLTSSDRRVIERAMSHSGRSPGKAVGRNTPCWCGSGRKFKHCHFGQATRAPLEERAEWLYQKAVNYLHHGDREARNDLMSVVLARADLSTPDELTNDMLYGEAVERASSDPLVLDLTLTELEWFGCFLADRAALLPPDEVLMAQAWELTERTLYEVVDTRPGEGLTLRDLRSAETIDVRERSFSRQGRVGMVFCGRAVPVGSTFQLVGGVFPVPPGNEADVLDLLDEGDPIAIAAYVARSERPPVLNNREHEPLTLRTVTVAVTDRAAVVAALTKHYEPDDSPGDPEDTEDPASLWLELHDIGGGEHVLRARLRLAGDQLTIEANSEVRMERVLDVLTTALGPLEIVSQTSTPLRTVDDVAAARPPGAAPRKPAELSPEERAAIEEFRSHYEERWCDESIPALFGLTPRQAAADPTRRETLERLILSFEHDDGDDPDAAPPFTMRPARLRSLLGLTGAGTASADVEPT